MAGFTEEVRQELSRLEVPEGDELRAELSAGLRLAGGLRLSGRASDPDRVTIVVQTQSGATARRLYALLTKGYDIHPELRVRAPGGISQRSTYGLAFGVGAGRVATEVGLLDQGRPVARLPPFVSGERIGIAYLRGAFLAGGSVSGPGRSPHFELVTGSAVLAEDLADVAGGWLDATVTAVADDRHRVVIKSGAAIADLLGRMGAVNAFLRWEERRLRRQVRSDATRLANADAANLRRTVEAAAEQTALVEQAVERVGWGELDDDLREVALARLANPSASLAELGEVCDPPLGKSAVHRRLQRLAELARTEDG